jgi:GxxExxY protein
MKRFAKGCDAKAQGANPEIRSNLSHNEVVGIIIGCAAKVHKVLGPGLSKSAYEECLGYALSKSLLEIERSKPMLLIDGELKLNGGHKLDFIANKKVILEIKSTDGTEETSLTKMHSCLKYSGCKMGLLIDFNVEQLASGIKRIMNNNYRCRSLRMQMADL